MLFTDGPVSNPTTPTELASVYYGTFDPGVYKLRVLGSTESATGRVYIRISLVGSTFIQWMYFDTTTGPFEMDFGKVEFSTGSGAAVQISVDTTVAAATGTFQATLVLEGTGFAVKELP